MAKVPVPGKFPWEAPFRGQGVLSVPSSPWDSDIFGILEDINQYLKDVSDNVPTIYTEAAVTDVVSAGNPIILLDATGMPEIRVGHRLWAGGAESAPCGYVTGGGVSGVVVGGDVLVGDVELAAGANMTVTHLGNVVTFASTGGGGGVSSLQPTGYGAITGAVKLSGNAGISYNMPFPDTIMIQNAGCLGIRYSGTTNVGVTEFSAGSGIGLAWAGGGNLQISATGGAATKMSGLTAESTWIIHTNAPLLPYTSSVLVVDASAHDFSIIGAEPVISYVNGVGITNSEYPMVGQRIAMSSGSPDAYTMPLIGSECFLTPSPTRWLIGTDYVLYPTAGGTHINMRAMPSPNASHLHVYGAAQPLKITTGNSLGDKKVGFPDAATTADSASDLLTIDDHSLRDIIAATGGAGSGMTFVGKGTTVNVPANVYSQYLFVFMSARMFASCLLVMGGPTIASRAFFMLSINGVPKGTLGSWNPYWGEYHSVELGGAAGTVLALTKTPSKAMVVLATADGWNPAVLTTLSFHIELFGDASVTDEMLTVFAK